MGFFWEVIVFRVFIVLRKHNILFVRLDGGYDLKS